MKVLDKIKVDVLSLKEGMYVCELDRPWIGSPFLLEGFMISGPRDIRKLQKCCNYVYIDGYRSTSVANDVLHQFKQPGKASKQVDIESQYAAESRVLDINLPRQAKQILGKGGSIADLPQPATSTSFIDELYQARKIYGRLHKEASKVFLAVTNDKLPVILPLIGLILEIMASIKRNSSAFEWITMTNPHDKSVQQHCINVCIHSLIFGHHIGLPDRINRQLGLAGLTFDLGKLVISDAIVKKTDRLTAAEMSVMQKHTKVGANILAEAGGVTLEVVNVCLRHHEKIDGTGYPTQMKGEDIDLLSRIVAIMDTYDAIITTKYHSDSSSPSRALDELYKLRNKAYDAELVEAFIRFSGMYPVGTAIETQTGEIGLVVSNDMKNKMSPMVLIALDARKQPYPEEKIVDFARTRNEKGQPKYTIKRTVNASHFSINPKDYFRD